MKTSLIQIKMHGFTLLEMLFALIIFSFALVSLMGIAGKGVVATMNAKENLTAQYLAEEILEVARNMRDSSWKSMDPNEILNTWNFLREQCGENGCVISSDQVSLEPCSSSSGQCGSLDGNLMNFSQKIIITPSGDDTDQYVQLKAVVEWNQRRVPRTYSLVTYLNP